MIFWLSPPRGSSSSRGTQPRWATSIAEGNSVTGYYGTGWVNVSASAPVIDGAAPSLHLQLWALNDDNEYYCAAGIDLSLAGHAH